MHSTQPFFSIVIPTYNRPQRLAKCLEAISRLDYQRDRVEVIIVDDGSPMSLDAVVNPYQEQLQLTLIRQDNAGPAKARNTGASHAKGDFLVFTDDDCQPDANWLQVFASHFQEHPDLMLGGYTINQLTENICSQSSQLLIDYLYDYYNVDGQEATFFASNNLALPRHKFMELGSFDTTFPLAAGEDRELCDRWLFSGYKMKYIPEATVYHTHDLKLPTFCKQHFNYGRGAFHFHQIRARRGMGKIKVEPFTFYFKLLAYPYQRTSLMIAPIISGLFFISQVANVAGFFWEKRLQN